MVRTPFLSHLLLPTFSLPSSGSVPSLAASLLIAVTQPQDPELQPRLSGCPPPPAGGSGSAQQWILGLFWRELGALAGRWLQGERCSCRSVFPGEEWKEEQRGLGAAWGCTSVPVSLGMGSGLEYSVVSGKKQPSCAQDVHPFPQDIPPSGEAAELGLLLGTARLGLELLPRLQGHRRGSSSPRILGSP